MDRPRDENKYIVILVILNHLFWINFQNTN